MIENNIKAIPKVQLPHVHPRLENQRTYLQHVSLHLIHVVDKSSGFHSLAEAEDLSCFIANFFPEPTKILLGIAALLINAVEHGNLQISYDEK